MRRNISSIFFLRVEQVIFEIRGTDARPIYAVSVDFKPCAHVAERPDCGSREFTVRLRGDVKGKIAAFAHDIKQKQNKLVSAFECIRIVERKLLPYSRTSFPRNTEGSLGDSFLRCDEVFILSPAGTVRDDQVRLGGRADLLHDLAETDVLSQIIGAHPASVQPEHIDFAVVRAQFPDLLMGKLYIFLPQIRMFTDIIIYVSVRCSAKLRSPVILAVPVRLGKVDGDTQALSAEFPEESADDVSVLMCMEGTALCCDLIVCCIRVIHTESVMMLCCKSRYLNPQSAASAAHLTGSNFMGLKVRFASQYCCLQVSMSAHVISSWLHEPSPSLNGQLS